MDINDIKTQYMELNDELKTVLSRMEYTDKVRIIHQSINDLRKICPHKNAQYDFSLTSECPYCGTKFNRNNETDPDWVGSIKQY